MILLTNIAFLFAAFVSGAAKRWKDYYNHTTTDLLNTFVLLPVTALMYLMFFPKQYGRQFAYYLGWVAGFSLIEYIWRFGGHITYDHGWNYLWSVAFYFAMFYALRIHHTNLVRALIFSLAATVLLIYLFKVPM